MRRGRMRRIGQTQARPTVTELDLIAVEQRNRLRDSLAVNQCPIEALQIDDGVLTVTQTNFSVATRDDRGISVDDDFAFRIAAQSRDFFGERDSAGLAGWRFFEVEMGGRIS